VPGVGGGGGTTAAQEESQGVKYVLAQQAVNKQVCALGQIKLQGRSKEDLYKTRSHSQLSAQV
jgi:hypothetical protein